MDNQFYPPNGGYPQGQPIPGDQTAGRQPVQGFDQQPGAYNPYDLQQSGYAAYMQPQQNVQQNPYQQPYGGAQQPYAEAGYEYHFDHTQSVMQEQAPNGFPPQQLVPQKPRLRLTAFHVAIIVAALGFLGWYLYATFVPEAAKYGKITAGNLSASHSGDCLIVRNEVPYDAEGVTSITYDAQEGSLVKRGDKICKVYSAGYSSNAIRQLQEYREQIRDYQKDLMEEDGPFDGKMTGYNENVMTLVREMRSILGGASGSLANQETLLATAVKKRQDYMEQQYTSDQRYSRLYDDERSQTQRIDSWTKQHTATTEAIVSFYSDGYEYSLTSNNYMNFEPTEVRAMINGYKPELSATQKGKTTIYRMVRDGEWYVLFLSDYTEWNPVKGQIYELSLERFEDTQVLAEVVEFTRAGGELLLRLRVTGPVEDMLYMRTCEAVLGESMSTLMANKRAIYMQDGMTGVVVVEGSTESFIPVNVVLTDGDNVYFQPIQQGLLFEGMTVRLF